MKKMSFVRWSDVDNVIELRTNFKVIKCKSKLLPDRGKFRYLLKIREKNKKLVAETLSKLYNSIRKAAYKCFFRPNRRSKDMVTGVTFLKNLCRN